MSILNPGNETQDWGQDIVPGNKSDTKTLQRYRDRITAAKRWREDERYDKTWKRLRDIYRLKMFNNFADEDRIAVALAFSTINVIGPSIAVNYPKITVNSRDESQDQQNKALIVQTVVNHWWRLYDFRDESRKAVQDFLVYGHGWGKVSWAYSERQRTMTPDERYEGIEVANNQLDDYVAQNPMMALEVPTHQDVEDLHPEDTIEVLHDAPVFERVSPFDVFVDPEATCLRDAQWIAQRIVMPLEVAKADERFLKSARNKLKSDGSLKWFNEDNKQNVPDDHGRVTVWEFYDLTTNVMSIFADQQKGVGFLVKPTEFPYPYGHPFVMLRNYEVPDQFYPIGEIEAIEPLQNELNHTRSAMVLARQLDIPKYMVRKDAMDTDALDALTSSDTNALVPIRDDTPFNEVIQPVPRNAANAMFYQNHSELITNDIDRITGVNEFMRGATPEIRRTATEANLVQDAANARAADKLARIETYISEVAERLVQLAQLYLTTDQVARMTTEQGASVWIPYSRDDIEGQFEFDVDAGSTQPQNEQFRRQQAMQMLQALGPFIGTTIDPFAITMHVLRDGFGIKNPERFMVVMPPQMPPGAEQGPPPGPEGPMPPSGPAPAPVDGAGVASPLDPAMMGAQATMQQQGMV